MTLATDLGFPDPFTTSPGWVDRYGAGEVSQFRGAELIAENIPSAASMCYDAGANQLVIPMNPNNGIAIVPLD